MIDKKKKLAILLALHLIRRRKEAKKIRIRLTYVRRSHAENASQRCAIFWRYYNSESIDDLSNFCRFSRPQFDALLQKVKNYIPNHLPRHRWPIGKKQRLAVFLRLN